MRFYTYRGRERYSFKYRIGSKIILVKDRENLRVSLLALLISIRSRCLSRLVKSKPRLLPSHFSFLLPLPPPRSFFRQHAARKCERISIHPRTCLVIIIYKNETLGKMEACRVSPVSFPGTDETFARRPRVEWDETVSNGRNERASVNLRDFFTSCEQVFRAKNLHAFPPDSKVSRCGDITYRLISFSRVFPNTSPPNRAKQPELSQKTCHLALSRFHGEYKDGNIYRERERGTERGSKEDREMYLDERRKYYPPGGRANNFLRLIFGGEGLVYKG